MEQMIVEARLASTVNGNDLAINDGVGGEMLCNLLCKVRERPE
jgi:hypothetical protein